MKNYQRKSVKIENHSTPQIRFLLISNINQLINFITTNYHCMIILIIDFSLIGIVGIIGFQ